MFKDERRRLALRVSDDIEKLNDVGAAAHVLEDLDFSLDLLLLDRLEDLDDALGVVAYIDSFENLAGQFVYVGRDVTANQLLGRTLHSWRIHGSEFARTYLTVLSASNLSNDFIIFLVSPIHSQGFVVPVVSRPMHVDIRIHSVRKRSQQWDARLDVVLYMSVLDKSEGT